MFGRSGCVRGIERICGMVAQFMEQQVYECPGDELPELLIVLIEVRPRPSTRTLGGLAIVDWRPAL